MESGRPNNGRLGREAGRARTAAACIVVDVTTAGIYTGMRQSRGRTISLLGAVLFSSGCILNALAYDSLQPLLSALVVYLVAALVLRVTPLGGAEEDRIFRQVFAVGWFMAGIAALYANLLNDPSQTVLDAAWFYDLASGATSGGSLEDLKVLTEGAGAVFLWRLLYDAFASLGFDRGRYVGVLLNVSLVAISGVIAVKTSALVYKGDEARIRRMTMLFCWCGLFWLFAAIHLRDAVILLSNAALSYAWTRYLAKSDMGNLALLIVATGLGISMFALFRTEFLFVPLAMLIAGLVAMLLFQRKLRPLEALAVYLGVAFGVAAAGVLYFRFHARLFGSLSAGYLSYASQAAEGADASSLGMALIVNQPMPVRLVLGSAYLYVYPIPFWIGFQLENAYQLFKSLNALYFYALIPLLALAFLQLVRRPRLRSPMLMFQVLLSLGFTLAIAGTSLETRHLGAFLVPILVVALLPDVTVESNLRRYRALLGAFLLMMAAIHSVWFVAKL